MNVFNEHCYAWIEAQTLDGAKRKFQEDADCDDFKKMLRIYETNNI